VLCPVCISKHYCPGVAGEYSRMDEIGEFDMNSVRSVNVSFHTVNLHIVLLLL